MKVVKLAHGTKWTVYATCNADGSCPVLDFILEMDEKRGNKILSDLQQYVPNSESREWVQTEFSWLLRGSDKILEFRWSRKKGGTPRIFWFYSKGRIVVCTHGVMKKGDTDEADIRHAEAIEEAFRNALDDSTLNVVSYKDYEEENENN